MLRGALLLVLTAAGALSSAAAADGPVRILALGDSLTAGYGLAAEDSFPAQLEAALRERGHQVTVINGGVSGDTTTGGLARLDWALADRPDAVIVELGANDGLRAIDPSLTRANLDQLLTRLRRQQLPVLLAGMLAPPNLGSEYADEFKNVFSDLAEQHEVLFYPFFLDGVAAEPALNQADGMHPTAAGVAVVVERIMPQVLRLLEQIPS